MLLAVLAICGGGSSLAWGGEASRGDNRVLEPVTLQLRWRHQFQFAGYYAAIEKGFYRDAGLEVSLREGRPGNSTITAVTSGQANFGISTSELVLHKLWGKPLVMLSAIFQNSPLILLALKESQITSPQDIRGRTVMLTDGVNAAEIRAMLSAEGVALEEVVQIPQSWNLQDLVEGHTDVITAYVTDQPFLLEKQGIAYNSIHPRTYGIDFYGDVLFTSKRELEQHPERVAAFRQASLRGWEYALAHPEEMTDLILEKYRPASGKFDRAYLRHEAAAIKKLMFTGLIEVGHISKPRVEQIAQTYKQLGIAKPNGDLSGFVYDPQPRYFDWGHWSIRLGIFAFGIIAGSLILVIYFHKRLQRSYAEVVKAEQIKSQFLASVSHEIRTPLFGILGMVRLLLDSESDRHKREHLHDLQASGNNLLHLINDVLDLARIESGKLETKNYDFDLRDTLEAAVAGFTQQTANKGLRLSCLIPAELPRTLKGDAQKLQQIVINLVGNAVKFTEKGNIQVRLSGERPAQGQICLHVEVEDTGTGIDEQDPHALFAPFRQGDGGTTRTHGGTGLGLAIVSQLVEQLGGEVGYHSQPGTGSCFWFALSFGVHADVDRTSDTPTPALQNRRQLIIEPNSQEAQALQQQLLFLGGYADIAHSIDDGRRRLQQALSCGAPYQLVFSSTERADNEGLTIDKLLLQEPALREIPVIRLNHALPMTDDASVCPLSSRTLIKPIRTHKLRKCLAEVFDTRALPLSTDGSAADNLKGPSLAGFRVLIVEDNEINAKIISYELHRVGAKTERAVNGKEAVKRYHEHHFDLILMDCQLPEMDGYQATRAIRKLEGSGPRIPIIAMTAHAMHGDKERCLQAGMDDYIAKAIVRNELRQALYKWLEAAPIEEFATKGTNRRDPEPFQSTSAIATVPDYLVDIFLRTTPPLLVNLRHHCVAGRLTAMRSTAHSLMGSCAALHVTEMTDLCRALQGAATTDTRLVLIERLESHYHELAHRHSDYAQPKPPPPPHG